MELEFNIKNQKLTRTDENELILNESANYMEATFTFTTSEWTDIDKYALFKAENGKAYCVELGTTCTKTVKIPYEVLKADFFQITIFGLGEDYRITTTETTIQLDRSGFTEEIYAPEPYDGDIFSQLREMIQNCLCDVRITGNHLQFYKNNTVYFTFEITNHNHTSNQITGLEDRIGTEIRQSYTILANKIRTYGA